MEKVLFPLGFLPRSSVGMCLTWTREPGREQRR